MKTHQPTGEKMVHPIKWLILLLSITITPSSILAERIQDKMYKSINGAFCFRRLNGTHSTGCASSFGGSVGALHLIKTNADFEFILNGPPAPPYTLIMSPISFTRDNVLQFKDNANITGIVVINDRQNLTEYSHESRCPNQYSGLKAEQTCDTTQADNAWNPFGTGLLLEDFPFPIIFVREQNSIDSILKCFHEFNEFDLAGQFERALCSIQIKSFMSAAVSSAVCMRRTKFSGALNPQRYCDPLQGTNMYATALPRAIVPASEEPRPVDKNEEIILVAARIDTTSMFDGLGLGAKDSLLPAITLLSTAHTLVQMLANQNPTNNKNVLFMLFNGEAYDYIGSQRFVYDVGIGGFPTIATQTQPIQMENIRLLIDIGSLDNVTSYNVYQYTNFSMAANMFDALKRFNDKYHFDIEMNQTIQHNLPPTSSHTFLRDNQSFPAMIFYSDSNKNRFYHSIYDDERNIAYVYKNTSTDFLGLRDLAILEPFQPDSIQIRTRNIATMVANALYSWINENSDYEGNEGANPVLIDELFYCYLTSSDCPVFRASAKDPKSMAFNPAPPYRYISALGSTSFDTITWTHRVIGLLTGRQTAEYTIDNCTVLPLSWFAGGDGNGHCLLTTNNISAALSPAFLNDTYDWTSTRWSTWTESTWRELNVRLFLKPPVAHEAFTLATGFIVMILSFVIVFFVNSNSGVLFGESTSSSDVLTQPAQC